MRKRKAVQLLDFRSIKKLVTNLGINIPEEKLQTLCSSLGRQYRESLRKGISFDEFKKYSTKDIEQYRHLFEGRMIDMFGAVPTFTVGFNFSLPCKEEVDGNHEISEDEREEYVRTMIETFNPIAIWSGTEYMKEQLQKMGYTSSLFPWFEQGGFMVVLKTPYPMYEPDESGRDK